MDSMIADCKHSLNQNQKCKQITYTKNSTKQKEERAFFKNRVKKAFLHWLYYKGLIPWKELPSFLDIHHKHPLGGGGSNEFTNLVIMVRRDHEKMNREIIEPQLRGIREGETREITVPWWNSEKEEFIDWEGIYRYLEELERSRRMRSSGHVCGRIHGHVCGRGGR